MVLGMETHSRGGTKRSYFTAEFKAEDSGSEESDVTDHGDDGSKRTRGRPNSGKAKLSYRCSAFYKEDHGHPLFGVSVNSHIKVGDPVIFATVGFNRVTVYEAGNIGPSVKMLQCYADPDPEENFYSCAWSYDPDTCKPILAAGGARGIVRVFSPASMTCVRNFVGHGNAINEVLFHPCDPNLLLSVSKDHALRLWNVKTEHNIAIFGGVEGHRDEVLSAHFNIDGTKIVSAGMDHTLMIWQFDSEPIQTAIALSKTHDTNKTKRGFPTELCHFPDFSTRDIHRNYVDCCRWFGDFVLSKSCENSIVCWKPGGLDTEERKESGDKVDHNKTAVIQKLEVKDCEIWFVRFSTDSEDKVLALGNTKGKIYTWDLMVCDPSLLRPTILSHPKCTTAVRQTSLSRDGDILIAVCDDGSIWRWDRIESGT